MTKVGAIIEKEKIEYGKEVAAQVKKEVTEQVTKEVTEQVTKAVTINVTKEVTEQVTKEVTEQVTKAVTINVTKEVTANISETMLNKAVISLVMLCKQANVSMADAVKNIMINFDLTEDAAREKVASYWT